MRVVVIGGNGHLGSRVVRALGRVHGLDVAAAGRRARRDGDVIVDLARPETFGALAGAAIVVNVSDATTTPPDALAAYCLEHGIVMVETTSDSTVVERLLAARRDRSATTPSGAVVLGAGIFTGVSNVMAGEAVRATPRCASVEIAVTTSPLSGAGAGTINLMVATLATPTRSVVDGAVIAGPPVSAGPRIRFPGGERATLHAPFAEPLMAHASTGVPRASMYIALVPRAMASAFLLTPLFVLRSAIYRALLRLYLSFLRGVVLRSRATAVELVAEARGPEGGQRIALEVDDGMWAGGVGAAAIVELLAKQGLPRGTVVVDELIRLDPLIDRMRAIAGGSLALRIEREATPPAT